jgi:hypothetical protein
MEEHARGYFSGGTAFEVLYGVPMAGELEQGSLS